MVRLCCERERALKIENSELAQYTNHDVVIQKRKCKQIILIMIFGNNVSDVMLTKTLTLFTAKLPEFWSILPAPMYVHTLNFQCTKL